MSSSSAAAPSPLEGMSVRLPAETKSHPAMVGHCNHAQHTHTRHTIQPAALCKDTECLNSWFAGHLVPALSSYTWSVSYTVPLQHAIRRPTSGPPCRPVHTYGVLSTGVLPRTVPRRPTGRLRPSWQPRRLRVPRSLQGARRSRLPLPLRRTPAPQARRHPRQPRPPFPGPPVP